VHSPHACTSFIHVMLNTLGRCDKKQLSSAFRPCFLGVVHLNLGFRNIQALLPPTSCLWYSSRPTDGVWEASQELGKGTAHSSETCKYQVTLACNAFHTLSPQSPLCLVKEPSDYLMKGGTFLSDHGRLSLGELAVAFAGFRSRGAIGIPGGIAQPAFRSPGTTSNGSRHPLGRSGRGSPATQREDAARIQKRTPLQRVGKSKHVLGGRHKVPHPIPTPSSPDSLTALIAMYLLTPHSPCGVEAG